MSVPNALYRELKGDVQQLASALFELSEVFVRRRGAFLPHGALLTTSKEVQLVAVPSGDLERKTSAIVVLPQLHEALRRGATQQKALALAVAEDVFIQSEGQKGTRAAKLLVEHQRGLCVALYMPFRRKLLRYSFESIFTKSATPEVRAWPRADDA